MNTLCVYYDLNNPDEQYDILKNYLEHFSGYTQAGDRIWFINSNNDNKSVIDEIHNLSMISGAKIIVFQVGEKWSEQNLQQATIDWMHTDWKP